MATTDDPISSPSVLGGGEALSIVSTLPKPLGNAADALGLSPTGVKQLKLDSTVQKDASKRATSKSKGDSKEPVADEEIEGEEEEAEDDEDATSSRPVLPPLSTPAILKDLFESTHGFPLCGLDALAKILVAELNEKHSKASSNKSGGKSKTKKKVESINLSSVKRTLSFYCTKDGRNWRVNDDAWVAAGMTEVPPFVRHGDNVTSSSSSTKKSKTKEKTEKESATTSSSSVSKSFFKAVTSSSSSPATAAAATNNTSSEDGVVDVVMETISFSATPSRRAAAAGDSSTPASSSSSSSSSGRRRPVQDADPRAASFVTSFKETVVQALTTYCGYSPAEQTSSASCEVAADGSVSIVGGSVASTVLTSTDAVTPSALSITLTRLLGSFANEPEVEKLVSDFQIAAVNSSAAPSGDATEVTTTTTLTLFTDEQAPLLAKIAQGSSSPLSVLASSIASYLSGNGLVVAAEAVAERLPRVMERHAHGIKPPKGVSSSEDVDHQECLWRWEACNLDHLLLPVEIKEKKKNTSASASSSSSSSTAMVDADASDGAASGIEDGAAASTSTSHPEGASSTQPPKSTTASRRFATIVKREKENLRILGDKVRSSKRLVELLTPPPIAKGGAKKGSATSGAGGAWSPDETKVVEANEKHLKALRAFDQLREKEAQRLEAEKRELAAKAVRAEVKEKEKEEKAKEKAKESEIKAKEKEAAKEAARLIKEQAKEKERLEEEAKTKKKLGIAGSSSFMEKFMMKKKPVVPEGGASTSTSSTSALLPSAGIALTASSSSSTLTSSHLISAPATSIASESNPSSSNDVVFLGSTAPMTSSSTTTHMVDQDHVVHVDPISGLEEPVLTSTTISHSKQQQLHSAAQQQQRFNSSNSTVRPLLTPNSTVRPLLTPEQLCLLSERVDRALRLGNYASSSSEMVEDDVQETFSAPSSFNNWVTKCREERRSAQVAATEKAHQRASAAHHRIAVIKAQNSLSSSSKTSSAASNNRPAINAYAAVFSSDFGGEENETDDAKMVRLGLAKGMAKYKVILPDPNYERPAYFGTWSREKAVETLRKHRNDLRERLLAASGNSGATTALSVAEMTQGWDPKSDGATSSAADDADGANVPYIDLQSYSHKKKRLSKRSPFGLDVDAFDYLVDSEAEWEEEVPGDDVEDLERASNDGDEDEEAALAEVEGNNRAGLDNLDYEDGWLCPDDVVTFDQEAIAKEKEKERQRKAEIDEARALKRAKKLAAEAGEAAVAASESGIGFGGAESSNKKKKKKTKNILKKSGATMSEVDDDEAGTGADASGSSDDDNMIGRSAAAAASDDDDDDDEFDDNDDVEIVPGENEACDSDLEILAASATSSSAAAAASDNADIAPSSSSSTSVTIIKRSFGVSATAATPGAALHILAKREQLDQQQQGGGGASKKRRIELTIGGTLSQIKDFSFGVCFNIENFLANNKSPVGMAVKDLRGGKVEAMGAALTALLPSRDDPTASAVYGLTISTPTPEEDLISLYEKLGLTSTGEKKKVVPRKELTNKDKSSSATTGEENVSADVEGGSSSSSSSKPSSSADKSLEAKLERAEKKAAKDKENKEKAAAKEAAIAEKAKLEAQKGVTAARLPTLVKLLHGSPAPIGKIVEAFKNAVEAAEGKEAATALASSKVSNKIKEIAAKGNWVLVQPSETKKKTKKPAAASASSGGGDKSPLKKTKKTVAKKMPIAASSSSSSSAAVAAEVAAAPTSSSAKDAEEEEEVEMDEEEEAATATTTAALEGEEEVETGNDGSAGSASMELVEAAPNSTSTSATSPTANSADNIGAVGVAEKFMSHDLEEYVLATMMALKNKDAGTAEYTKSRWVVKSDVLLSVGMSASAEMAEAAATIVAWVQKKIEKAGNEKSLLMKIAIPSFYTAKGGSSGSALKMTVIPPSADSSSSSSSSSSSEMVVKNAPAPPSPIVRGPSSSGAGNKRKDPSSSPPSSTQAAAGATPSSATRAAKKSKIGGAMDAFLSSSAPVETSSLSASKTEEKGIDKTKSEEEIAEDDSFSEAMVKSRSEVIVLDDLPSSSSSSSSPSGMKLE